MPSFDPTLLEKSEFISALAGSLVGGLFTLLGVAASEFVSHYRERTQTTRKIRACLRSLNTELGVINRKFLRDYIDSKTEEDTFNQILFIHEDFMPVYEASLHLIGEIEEERLRDQIILVYSLLTRLVSLIVQNNEIIASGRTGTTIARSGSIESFAMFSAASARKEKLKKNAERIERAHDEFQYALGALHASLPRHADPNVTEMPESSDTHPMPKPL